MICLVLTIFANLFPAAPGAAQERTFLAVKPDGVQRRLVGEVVRRFERKGFKLVALKLVQASEELLREHYAELRGRPFFGRLIEYMRSGPVVAMVSLGGRGAGALGLPALTRAPAGVAGAGCRARLEDAHWGHRPGGRLPWHHPRGLLRGGRQECDPRQRLAGECPPGDCVVVPRRRAAVLGGQLRALAARVALPTLPRPAPACRWAGFWGPVHPPYRGAASERAGRIWAWSKAHRAPLVHSPFLINCRKPVYCKLISGRGGTVFRRLLHTGQICGFTCRAKA
ncbi:nucleoside diphosphate kinase 3 isoform X1 [Perognathus longimembris pacificus]|uniref:nucleoside diphosphate kinase 3 isoform X1 n=1 Tax=Perognathus longimembris pacificus TaxID=214514 RepID=UPI002019DB1B|nr:nucleoside diphosphate kinase 3 isoform X1 [Perognathus longimembris pacificus]